MLFKNNIMQWFFQIKKIRCSGGRGATKNRSFYKTRLLYKNTGAISCVKKNENCYFYAHSEKISQ